LSEGIKGGKKSQVGQCAGGGREMSASSGMGSEKVPQKGESFLRRKDKAMVE